MFIADFHIHSKYSRATSKECVPEYLDLWARKKGLHLIGTGDFTHPAYRRELREKLVPAEEGLYRLGPEYILPGDIGGGDTATRFVVTGEISSIYKKNGRVRKVHNLIILPGLEQAETLSRRLEAIGNLHSDGRPILGLDSRDLLEITLEASPDAIFIPAHIWTPHFSLFGAYSGFDDIEECFGDLTCHIHALETGLSSNPPMNWRLSALDRFTLVSNSDAHSPGNLAREANLFDTELSYPHIARALEQKGEGGFAGTIEFFPEEGKYHFDGHRNCKVCQSPSATIEAAGVCPVCGGKVTVGVLHRVEALADRQEGYVPQDAQRFESLIPLPEVLAASTGFSAKSKKGSALYHRLLAELGSELHILRDVSTSDVAEIAGPAAAEGVRRLRTGEVDVSPGFDGEYGKVSILRREEIEALSGQTRLFFETALKQAAEPAKAPVPKPAAKETPAPVQTPPVDVLESLNEAQRAAAFSEAVVTAVVAGPGTGKTGTLVARIAHLAQRQGVPASRVTAVTFTNKAAEEMRQRLARQLGGKRSVSAMTIGTFHAICLQLLRRDGLEPCIIDDASAADLLEEVLRERGDNLSPREAARRISLRKCGADAGEDLPQALYDAYCQRLRDYGVMDYDDILLAALAREGPPEKCFAHLLVDEFQDSNPVQHQLIRKWSADSRGLFVIGDPNQSIYGFRGSDARCFDWLQQDHPDLTEITLTANYRSTPQILGAAAPVVAGGGGAVPRLEPHRPAGPRVRLVRAESPRAEAIFTAKAINGLIGGVDMLDSDGASGVCRSLSDIAVLYRTNRQAALLEECLTQEGIPYTVSGRDDSLSHPGATAMLAFFRLLLRPADLLSLRLCLKHSGCPGEQARKVLDAYRPMDKTTEALLQILEEMEARSLAELLRRHAPGAAKAKPQKLMAAWLEDAGMNGQDWADKLLHMAVFHPTVESFVNAVALGQEGDLQRHGGGRYTPDGVSLMTLHGAKGLEYPVVLLCGAGEGFIPYNGFGGRPSDQDEERRLLYVGMTRAKDELILVHSGEPSPFLSGLPEWLLAQERARPNTAPSFRQFSLFDA